MGLYGIIGEEHFPIGTEKHICSRCGEPFPVYINKPYAYKTNHGMYCSWRCFLADSKKQSAERSKE
jgi:DNA-directed RNA polymerase subunit RPC12/RpoP